jgi:hypothetical protein
VCAETFVLRCILALQTVYPLRLDCSTRTHDWLEIVRYFPLSNTSARPCPHGVTPNSITALYHVHMFVQNDPPDVHQLCKSRAIHPITHLCNQHILLSHHSTEVSPHPASPTHAICLRWCQSHAVGLVGLTPKALSRVSKRV